MPVSYHYHAGVPCNPPAAGGSCDAPGDLIHCSYISAGIFGFGHFGGRLKCIHYLPPLADESEDAPNDSGDGTQWQAPKKIKLKCASSHKGLQSGIVMGGDVDRVKKTAIDNGKEDVRKNAQAEAERLARYYECEKPCELVVTVDIDYWEPPRVEVINQPPDDPPHYSAIWLAEWHLNIDCVLLEEEGEPGD